MYFLFNYYYIVFNQSESDYGLEYLSYKMMKMIYLKVIDLSSIYLCIYMIIDNEITDYGLECLTNTFCCLPNIIDINISYNNITSKGIESFSNNIKWIKQLR